MRNSKTYLLFSCLLCATVGTQAYAQQDYSFASNRNGSGKRHYSAPQQEKKQVLMDALRELNKTKGVYFLYSDQAIGSQQVNVVTDYKKDIEKILTEILKNTGLTFKKISENTYVILTAREKKEKQLQLPNDFQLNLPVTDRIQAIYPLKGRIAGADGAPLAGVSITVKGSSRGTTTNANGEFALDVNAGEVLVISYVGYEPQELRVTGNEELNITLMPANREISEVVVTALGIRREAKRLGYSVTKVSGEDFTQAREINLGNALTGKIAGVNSSGPLTGPGGSSRVLIRGVNSLTGDNQPLYVVNGIPMNNNNLGSAGMWGGADLGEGLSSINPDDIEEISVLKGAAAAALYGQIARNGVILITTKSGRGRKGLGIELNSNVQLDRINNFLDFQNVYGQGTLGQKPTDVNSAMSTGMSSWGARLDGSSVPVFNGQSMPYSAQGDNLNRFYETGATFTNTLAIASGSETGNFRLSLGDLRNNSVYPNSRYIRNTVNLDLNYKLSTKWSGQASLIYSKELGKNRSNLSDAPGNGNYGILLLPPNVNANYLAPGMTEAGAEIQFSDDAFTTNPYFAANRFQNNTNKNRVLGVASLRFNPLEWMYVQARIGNDFFAFNATQITPTGTAYRPGGSLDNEVDRYFNEINTDVMVGANRNLSSSLSLGLTLGANLLQQRQRINTINASGLAFPYLYNPGAATTRGANTATPRKDVRSVYGSLELGFKNFLFVNLTDRNDWSSTIPVANNSYNYPSVNASYIFSEHLKANWLSFGKLRVGYAQVGADAEPFQTSLYYNTNGAVNGHPLGNLGNTIPNSRLEPLQIKEFEIGTQLGLFKNRLTVDVAWYDKQTLNDIVQGTVSLTSGYTSAVVNVGKVQNKGFELLLSGSPVVGRNFGWKSSFNYSRNNNKVIELAEGQAFMDMAQSRTTRGFIHHRLNLPAYQVMVYDFKRDAKGSLVLNASGFPQASDALVSAGTSIHPTYGGWNNALSYKNIGLEFLVDYKFGGVIYSGTNARAYAAGLHKATLEGRDGGVKVEGVGENGSAMSQTIPAQNYYRALADISLVQTYSADFIKMRSMALSYNIPARVFNNRLQGATISLVGRNLFYIKRDTPNIDPEANYSNGFSVGLEYASLPSTRTYGLNLNLKF